MRVGERQVAPSIDGIRRDHVSRYEWARDRLTGVKTSRTGDIPRIIDLACGVGYGSSLLSSVGLVLALDADADAIAYARQHYPHPYVDYRVKDARRIGDLRAPSDAAVCFETIEHLADPLPMLRWLHAQAPLLIASVPNQRKFPWTGQLFHFRHYTKPEFEALLLAAGYEALEWWGQDGSESEVASNVNGRTLIVVAQRSSKTKSKTKPTKKFRTDIDLPFLPPPDAPKSVAILGLGPSLKTYVGFATRMGARHRLADEVWAINAAIDVIKCDLGFHMDDVRIQQIRADAMPTGNIAAMLPWLKTTTVPVLTSRSHPDYPNLIEFPLAEVLNSCRGHRYFNSTAAYAVAYAIHRGVKKIMCFGCDFSMPNVHHAEAGRACMEFWLGMAAERGIDLSFPKSTTLLDANVEPRLRLYGYDTVDVEITGHVGSESVKLTPRETLPTAAEIESRYDHSKHPNALAGVE